MNAVKPFLRFRENPAHVDSSERTHQGADRDDGGKRYEGADDADHHDDDDRNEHGVRCAV